VRRFELGTILVDERLADVLDLLADGRRVGAAIRGAALRRGDARERDGDHRQDEEQDRCATVHIASFGCASDRTAANRRIMKRARGEDKRK
jgi:hypothetical protein